MLIFCENFSLSSEVMFHNETTREGLALFRSSPQPHLHNHVFCIAIVNKEVYVKSCYEQIVISLFLTLFDFKVTSEIKVFLPFCI